MVEIVADISGNHGGYLSKAITMIHAAAKCGCDHAKFQFYRPEDMPDSHNAMYRRLMVPEAWLPELFEAANLACIGLFASVFSVRAVETLLQFDVPYIKVASPESTRLPVETYDAIMEAAGAVDVIISTGFHDYHWMRDYNAYLMFCPPGHPPEITGSDLKGFVAGAFWGFSDHTPGIEVPLKFIRREAKMVEKHFKLDVDDRCVDAAFSADPGAMARLCKLAHR